MDFLGLLYRGATHGGSDPSQPSYCGAYHRQRAERAVDAAVGVGPRRSPRSSRERCREIFAQRSHGHPDGGRLPADVRAADRTQGRASVEGVGRWLTRLSASTSSSTASTSFRREARCAPGGRLPRRGARHRPAPARVDPVDQMKEQRQRGQERTILRQVREQHRMVLLSPQPVLQIGPPPVEELLGRGLAPSARAGLWCRGGTSCSLSFRTCFHPVTS